MLPILFTLHVPAGWMKPLSLLLFAGVAVGRAWVFRRRLAQQRRSVGWYAAFWDDRFTLGLLAVLLAGLWWMGALNGTIRLPVHSYGVGIAIAFIVSVLLAQYQARQYGLDAERVGDLLFWILIAALVGSRIYYILVNPNEYFGTRAWVTFRGVQIPRLLAFWEGGLVFYGGFLGALAVSWYYVRRHDMKFLPYADIVFPCAPFGHFFGRIGCFLAGCCFGAPSDAHLPWLVKFPPESIAFTTLAGRSNGAQFLTPDRLSTIPLHPTQLYEAFGELAIFLFLFFYVRPRKKFHGQVAAGWLLTYSILRSTLEFFRGDAERGFVLGIPVGQWTSLGIFLGGVATWVIAQRIGKIAPSSPAPARSRAKKG